MCDTPSNDFWPARRTGGHLYCTSVSAAARASSRLDLKVGPFAPDDHELVRGIKAGEPWASRLLVERYGPIIERILRRALGLERHTELADVVHEVFAEALSSASRLRDSAALLAWLKRICVHTAFRTMRRRRARAWLHFADPSVLPAHAGPDVDYEGRDACRRVYEVLARMPAKEQLVFSLRYLEGMELTEVADACDASLSTVKRRLLAAEVRFIKLGSQDSVLKLWIDKGGRWKP
jgi:RNA polymerase sigma-70 factor (ECF subfamily)